MPLIPSLSSSSLDRSSKYSEYDMKHKSKNTFVIAETMDIALHRHISANDLHDSEAYKSAGGGVQTTLAHAHSPSITSNYVGQSQWTAFWRHRTQYKPGPKNLSLLDDAVWIRMRRMLFAHLDKTHQNNGGDEGNILRKPLDPLPVISKRKQKGSKVVESKPLSTRQRLLARLLSGSSSTATSANSKGPDPKWILHLCIMQLTRMKANSTSASEPNTQKRVILTLKTNRQILNAFRKENVVLWDGMLGTLLTKALFAEADAVLQWLIETGWVQACTPIAHLPSLNHQHKEEVHRSGSSSTISSSTKSVSPVKRLLMQRRRKKRPSNPLKTSTENVVSFLMACLLTGQSDKAILGWFKKADLLTSLLSAALSIGPFCAAWIAVEQGRIDLVKFVLSNASSSALMQIRVGLQSYQKWLPGPNHLAGNNSFLNLADVACRHPNLAHIFLTQNNPANAMPGLGLLPCTIDLDVLIRWLVRGSQPLTDPLQRTPLHLAAKASSIERVAIWLHFHPDVLNTLDVHKRYTNQQID